jgi:osmoprotectant transport system permease protein
MSVKVEHVIKILLLSVLGGLLAWFYSSGAFKFILDNPDDLVYLAKQHLKLVGLSSVLAIMFAVPAGILVTRKKYRKFQWIFTNFANIGQTVPSLAILAIVMTFMGIGYQTAVFALWINSLLPILRNTIAGIENVNPAILDAGRGMGMSEGQILWKLELPNSLYAILAGVRTATVINVGTASLAFLIGGGGLGDLIFTGISLFDTGIMLAGAIPIIVMAVIIDFLLERLEKTIISKGLRQNANAL